MGDGESAKWHSSSGQNRDTSSRSAVVVLPSTKCASDDVGRSCLTPFELSTRWRARGYFAVGSHHWAFTAASPQPLRGLELGREPNLLQRTISGRSLHSHIEEHRQCASDMEVRPCTVQRSA